MQMPCCRIRPAKLSSDQAMNQKYQTIVSAIAVLVAITLLGKGCGNETHMGADSLIDELTFADPVLAACVARDARQNDWDVSGRVTSLRCTNPEGDQVRDLSGIEKRADG